MLPRRYSSEAIVLSRRNFKEADRILTLFTKEYGKLTVLAKGIRKPSSRKRGSLEVFSKIKFAASRAKGFDIMTEAELLDSYSYIRTDIIKVSVAYFFMETVRRLIEEEEKHSDYYTYVSRTLDDLCITLKLRTLREKFIKNSLTILGFWPSGKQMNDPDDELEKVVEREMVTKRVGKVITG